MIDVVKNDLHSASSANFSISLDKVTPKNLEETKVFHEDNNLKHFARLAPS